MSKLTVDDIVDLRAYEREREEFRAHIIQLKKKRRVSVGPFVTALFENSDTIRFQVQEMARVEKIISDEGIETELRIYNPLIPEPGHLAATLFVELTSETELREWLPKLVGIERSVAFRIGSEAADGSVEIVRCQVDPQHEKQLTRDEITASVHYIHFELTPEQIDRFEAGPVHLVLDHPEYAHDELLRPEAAAELLRDLRQGG
jgi:hypothetical protein